MPGDGGIEVFHRTLKRGCQIENRQLGNADRIEACLAIDMVVAGRIFHLTKLGRETPKVPCADYFEELEWKALVGCIRKNPIRPAQPPSLREAIRRVASLGGFLGRKGEGGTWHANDLAWASTPGRCQCRLESFF